MRKKGKNILRNNLLPKFFEPCKFVFFPFSLVLLLVESISHIRIVCFNRIPLVQGKFNNRKRTILQLAKGDMHQNPSKR